MVRSDDTLWIRAIPGRLPTVVPTRVLLVDSSPDFLLAERTYFGEHARVEVVGHALTAEQGLARFREAWPDVAIVDLLVPPSGGLDLVARMRRLRPDAVLVLTALRDGAEYARAAAHAGADAFVSKATFCDDVEALLRRVTADRDRRLDAVVHS